MIDNPDSASDALDDELQWAVDELRVTPLANAAWRAALAEALRDEVPPTRQLSPSIRMTPMLQLAAALACVAIGAAGALAVRSGRPDAAPANPLVASSADSSDVGVHFAIVAPGVQRVSLVGDFNRWDAAAAPLRLARDGVTWTTTLPLPAGRHTYAFVIDGQVVADPAAPSAPENDFGVPNSLLLVSSLK